MGSVSVILLEAAILAASVSIDAFAAAFAYGCKKIKISVASINIINLICTCIIGLSFFFGSLLTRYIPPQFALWLSFSILFVIGLTKLFDSITKSFIRRHTQFNKEIKLSVFNFKLAMRVYADPEEADADVSKSISPREAAVLAVSLSLDGIAVGFGAAIIGINAPAVILFSLVMGFAALLSGGQLGNRAAEKIKFNISWLGGVMLIGLAVGKFF